MDGWAEGALRGEDVTKYLAHAAMGQLVAWAQICLRVRGPERSGGSGRAYRSLTTMSMYAMPTAVMSNTS